MFEEKKEESEEYIFSKFVENMQTQDLKEEEKKQESSWVYNALNELTPMSDFPQIVSETQVVHLVMYLVNKETTIPFLEFGVIKFFTVKGQTPSHLNDLLYLPFFFSKQKDEILIRINQSMKSWLKPENPERVNFEMDGFLQCGQTLFVFTDISSFVNPNRGLIQRNDMLWFLLPEEIINIRTSAGFPVESSVSNFFMSNPKFLRIQKKENNENWEHPTVVYAGVPQKKLEFTNMFGAFKKTSPLHSRWGPYYYFTNFKGAIEEEFKDEYKKDKTSQRWGVVKFALFRGKQKVLLHDDEPDISQIRKDVMKIKEGDEIKKEEKMYRVSDYEGKWVENYDTMYCGKRTDYHPEPEWVAKEYHQFVALGYHIVDPLEKIIR
jgi:hypothetical protein